MSADVAAELRQALEEQLTALRRLNDLLEAEGEALTARQAERIDRLRTEKQQALGHLTRSAQTLDQLLEREGFSADAAGLDAMLGERDRTARLGALRTQVNQALAACRRLNQINGIIAERSRRSIEQALRILTCPGDNTDLYQASGKLGSPKARRTIGKA